MSLAQIKTLNCGWRAGKQAFCLPRLNAPPTMPSCRVWEYVGLLFSLPSHAMFLSRTLSRWRGGEHFAMAGIYGTRQGTRTDSTSGFVSGSFESSKIFAAPAPFGQIVTSAGCMVFLTPPSNFRALPKRHESSRRQRSIRGLVTMTQQFPFQGPVAASLCLHRR